MGAPPVGAPPRRRKQCPQVTPKSEGRKAGPSSGLNPQTLQPLQKDGDTPPFL